MSTPFVSRWLEWNPDTPYQPTDKTDKRDLGESSDQPSTIPRPTPEGLLFSTEDVKDRLPYLTPGHRAFFDDCLDLYLSGGWSLEEAERGALGKTLGLGPKRLKEMGIWRDYPEKGTG